jgi:DNA-3-methyladenine glycosylase II
MTGCDESSSPALNPTPDEAYAAGRPRGIGYRPSVDDALFRRTVQTLTATDGRLAALVDEHGVPPLWLRPAGFPSLALFILEQQVSLASAAAAYRKVVARTGAMTPTAVLATTPEELRLAGVSRQKDRYLRALATAVETGALDLPGLAALDDDDVRRTLMTLPGVGVWTADVYLLACLGRPDLWPVGDRALQVAAAEALGLDEVPDRDELAGIGEAWRPYRSTAARLLWHGYLVRRNRVETPNSLFG